MTTGQTSILIINYNGRDYLTPCLDSVLATIDQDAEVIVVDNASTDGSAEFVSAHYPAIQLIRSEKNLGFAGACNLAARQARSETLVFLNPDTIVEPGWLAALVAPLATEPTVGLTTAKVLLMEPKELINTAGNNIHLSGLTLCRGMGEPASTLNQPVTVGAVSGAVFAIRRDLFQELGGFDERFFMYVEDTDLSLRARVAGFECRYVPESVVRHDYTLRFGPQKTYYQERNRYRMLLKNLRWRTLVGLLPALLLAEVVTWGYSLLHDRRRWRNKLRAYGDIAAHWSSIMQERRRVQAGRRSPDRAWLLQSHSRLDYSQTGTGLSARLAHLAFDPLFWLWRRLMVAVVHW